MIQTENKVRIISNTEIAPGAYILQFLRSFDFEAGQVISISVAPGGEARMYSIASGNQEALVDILYTLKPDGLLTPQLTVLKRGDEAYASRPYGKFLARHERALWIATGTGIAPFISQALSGHASGKTLIYGGKDSQRLYYHAQLKGILGSQYISCCSRNREDGHFFGRVTDFLADWPDLDNTMPCYICGSAEMVVDVRDMLIEKGVAFDRIYAEIFF